MAELLGFSLDSVSCLCGIYLLLHFHSCVGLTGVHFRLSPSVIYALLKYNFFKYMIYVHDMENDMMKTKTFRSYFIIFKYQQFVSAET